jgi:hypothetical protein
VSVRRGGQVYSRAQGRDGKGPRECRMESDQRTCELVCAECGRTFEREEEVCATCGSAREAGALGQVRMRRGPGFRVLVWLLLGLIALCVLAGLAAIIVSAVHASG